MGTRRDPFAETLEDICDFAKPPSPNTTIGTGGAAGQRLRAVLRGELDPAGGAARTSASRPPAGGSSPLE
jgi:hypothetical protein